MAFSTRLVRLLARLVFAAFASLGLLLLLIAALSSYAEWKADRLRSALTRDSVQDTVLAVAAWAARDFQNSESAALRALYRRHSLYNKYLPARLALRRGALEFVVARGLCNDLVRALEFLLEPAGYDVLQTDIITPRYSHSAITVRARNETYFIDPLLGYAFFDANRLLSITQIQELARNGRDLNAFARPLRGDGLYWIYDHLERAFIGIGAEPLEIVLTLPTTLRLPALHHEEVSLGLIDGHSTDVMWAGVTLGVTSHLFYLGPKYRQNFRVRVVNESGAEGFEVVFHLIGTIDPGDLPRSNIVPTLAENTVSYECHSPCSGLTLDYRDMKRWYPVDMITVRRL